MWVSGVSRSLACQLILFAVLTFPIAAEETERFYRLEMGGQPAGWLVERTFERETKDGVLLVTESQTRMELSRAGTAAAVEMFSRFEETVDHRPVSGLMRQTLGTTPLVTSFRFGDGEVLVSEPGASDRTREMGVKNWMTPVEASQHVARQVRRAYAVASASRASPTDEQPVRSVFEVRRLELLTGLDPITGRYVLQDADDPIEIEGELRAAGRWAISESYAPLLTTIAWIDREGILLRTEASMMGTSMVVTIATDDPRAESVLRSARPSAELPEMLVQSFVRPDRAIESPRTTRRGVYRLRVAGLDGRQLLEIVPSAGTQTVQPDGDTLLVTVDLDQPGEPQPITDPEALRRPSRYLDFDSEPVRELLAAWRLEKADAASAESDIRRAESLRRWVAAHLRDKNLGTILGSASETAANGSGDCTEHAVLLAALLRAEGIPSRVAVGLIYAERFAGEHDIFAYHMWTQAWIDGDRARWFDLDATLPVGASYDATHLLFSSSALDDEGIPLLGTGAEALFGRLSIEVVEIGPLDSPSTP